jgi:hypothetical protein
MTAPFNQIWIEDMRLVILRSLEQTGGYSCNDSILQDILKTFGHRCSRDQVRTELSWLKEQGYLTYEVLSTGTYIATITQRGTDVARGDITVPGIKRPGPGN